MQRSPCGTGTAGKHCHTWLTTAALGSKAYRCCGSWVFLLCHVPLSVFFDPDGSWAIPFALCIIAVKTTSDIGGSCTHGKHNHSGAISQLAACPRPWLQASSFLGWVILSENMVEYSVSWTLTWLRVLSYHHNWKTAAIKACLFDFSVLSLKTALPISLSGPL